MRIRTHRRAISLIELVITMSAGSTVMILAIGMVHRSMTLSSADSRQSEYRRSLDRLETQFRNDVHGASQWQVDSDGQATLGIWGGSQVTYQYESAVVTRTQHDAAQQRRETYRLDPSAIVHLQTLTNPDRAVLTVSVPPPGQAETAQRLDCHIEAVVGLTIALQQTTAEVSP